MGQVRLQESINADDTFVTAGPFEKGNASFSITEESGTGTVADKITLQFSPPEDKNRDSWRDLDFFETFSEGDGVAMVQISETGTFLRAGFKAGDYSAGTAGIRFGQEGIED